MDSVKDCEKNCEKDCASDCSNYIIEQNKRMHLSVRELESTNGFLSTDNKILETENEIMRSKLKELDDYAESCKSLVNFYDSSLRLSISSDRNLRDNLSMLLLFLAIYTATEIYVDYSLETLVKKIVEALIVAYLVDAYVYKHYLAVASGLYIRNHRVAIKFKHDLKIQ